MMKKSFLLSVLLFLSQPVFAETKCFIAMEGDKFLEKQGECEKRHSPCSTFKIAISLMGYEEGILVDETHPEFPFKKGYSDWLESWKQPQNPTTWMKNSCVWYSQVATQKLGMPKFSSYLQKFNYGNQDSSGDPGKNNGLTHAWLSSSLKISPLEQMQFIRNLTNDELPVSIHSQQMTKKILFLENLDNGWKLYGKTGSGHLFDTDGEKNPERWRGWFVGWIENSDTKRTILFVHYTEDEQDNAASGGIRAKESAREKLKQLIKTNS